MLLFSWLRKRPLARSSRRWDGLKDRPTARRFRPRLEALDERWLPSTTYTVNSLVDASVGSGTVGSLRYCIAAANANAGSTIDMTSLTGTINLRSTLAINSPMEIDGPGAASLTVSGQNRIRVFMLSGGGPITINDLTIANGGNVTLGAGMFDIFSTVNLNRVTFANNQALVQGGALVAFGADVTVTSSLFVGNQVAGLPRYQFPVGGGAIY